MGKHECSWCLVLLCMEYDWGSESLVLYGVWLRKWKSCFIWSMIEKVKVLLYMEYGWENGSLVLYGVWLRKWKCIDVWCIMTSEALLNIHLSMTHFIMFISHNVHCNYCNRHCSVKFSFGPLYSFIFVGSFSNVKKWLWRGCTGFPKWKKQVKS